MSKYSRRISEALKLNPHSRHRLILIVSGLCYITIGIIYRTIGGGRFRKEALYVANQLMSLESWGLVFMVVGILCIIFSTWSIKSKLWGYILLIGLSAAWSAFYFASIISNHSPPENVLGGITWGLISFLWWAFSGMVNPGRSVSKDGPR